jgi:hypothetical protein
VVTISERWRTLLVTTEVVVASTYHQGSASYVDALVLSTAADACHRWQEDIRAVWEAWIGMTVATPADARSTLMNRFGSGVTSFRDTLERSISRRGLLDIKWEDIRRPVLSCRVHGIAAPSQRLLRLAAYRSGLVCCECNPSVYQGPRLQIFHGTVNQPGSVRAPERDVLSVI